MAVVVGEAAVRLRPETSSFGSEAESEIDSSIPGAAKKAAGYFVAAFAAVKVGEFLKDAVGQASDLSESASKVQVVFGDASQGVLDFAHTAAVSLGQSEQQALEATGTFGNLLRSLGLGAQASADMSTKFVGLAGDLASFNNTDPADALDALRAGLTGETEPLKRYGVNLNQAAIQAEALRLGLAHGTGQLTASAQAQAAYSLIMQQTALAQGDFARTSGGLANQTRILAAQFTDVKANIGSGFLPFVNMGARGLTGLLMPALLTGTSYLKDFGQAVSDAGGYFSAGLNDADVTGLAVATSRLGDTFQGLMLNAGTAANVVQGQWYTFAAAVKTGGDSVLGEEPGLTGFLQRFGSGLHGVAENAGIAWMSVRTSATTALAPLASQLAPTILSVKASIGSMFDTGALAGSGSGFLGFLNGIIGQVTPIITGLIDKIAPVLATILPQIGNAVAAFVPVVQGVFAQLGPAIAQILPVIMQVAGFWRDVFLGAFEALLPVLPTILAALGQLVSLIAGALGPILSSIAPVISSVATALQTGLVGVIQSLVPVIPTLVTAITQVVTILSGAFLGVLQALLPVIPTIVDVIGQLASIIAKGLGQALQAIVPILPQIAQLLGTVAKMLAGALAGALQAILPILPPLVDALVQIATTLIGVLMSALSAVLPIIPQLVQVFVLLIQSALVPLLPILPILANLLATIISAVAPLIPVVIQVVALLIQLAIAAVMPLMPVLVIAANLFAMLIEAIVPIIQVVVAVAGAIIGFASTVIGTVVGFVSTVVGVFTGLIGAVTSIFGTIFGVISGVWNSIFGFVSGIVRSIAGTIGDVFRGVGDAIGNVFRGISNFVGGVFDTAVGAVKGVINTIIGILNGAIGFINDKLIDTANKVPFVDIPHIPTIPKLHEGGYFESGQPTGEGFALLRDRELVATPEQQSLANDLLGKLLAGNLPTPGAPGAPGAPGTGVTIQQHITQQPGEDGTVLAARVTQGVVWNLNAGITRRVGVGAESTP